MRLVLKLKWLIVSLLVVVTAGLFLLSPNLSKLAEEAGTFQLPDDADSQIAAEILEEAGSGDETISVVYVLDEPVTNEMKENIKKIGENIEELGKPVKEVLQPFENEQLEEQLVSEDKKTVLIPITVDGSEEEVIELAETIRSDILPKNESVYMTGETLINHDVDVSAQAGLKKTEVITVILIFTLLLIVFRSFVTPFIPLLAVGISYLLSQSLVAFFVEWFGFPVSNYTQIFLVAILFGIGTDYCILLLSRYKEELQTASTVEDAIVNTYRTAGRTLFISALAVFIGFSAIGFAQFPIFKSAVGVAVGIAVLLIVLYTVIPFFMAILKEKLFWPSKKAASHQDSKLWIAISKVSVLRPFVSIVIVAIITIPIVFTYDNEISYDMTDEIDRSYESVKGLRAIERGFGEGDSFPVKVVIKTEKSLVQEDIVPYVESISKEIEKIDNVKTVRTLTRPTGEVIDELNIDHQLGLMADHMEEITKGLDEIQGGLKQIEGGLTKTGNAIPDSGQAQSAGQQLHQAADGIGQINTQLEQISGGLMQGMPPEHAIGSLQALSAELEKIGQGIDQAATQMEQSGSQVGALGKGLNDMSSGVNESAKGLKEISKGLAQFHDLLAEMSEQQSIRDTGMFIPKGALDDEAFQPILDLYTFGDETGVAIEVVLDINPYSPEAIDTMEEVKDTVKRAALGTPFEKATIAYSGVSSINTDLKEVTAEDFQRTVSIMLVCLAVILAILFRSFIMPLYMLGSLLLTYYTSVGVAELIFVDGLGYDGITWAVPFFGFAMLIALGVDYSIFLLDRFREESINGLSVKEALKHSMAKMGTVVITAAVILAGTFAAMMPSGVLSLIQIATIVITGLLFYGVIILPLLIPAITVSFGEGAWWPFRLKQKQVEN